MIMYTINRLFGPLSTVEIFITTSSQTGRSLYCETGSRCSIANAPESGSSSLTLPFPASAWESAFLDCGGLDVPVRLEPDWEAEGVARFLDFVAEGGAGRPPCLFQYSSMISVEPLRGRGRGVRSCVER